MALLFPSEEWIGAYKDAINASEAYAKAAQNWHAGAVALVLSKQPDIGLDEDWCIWLGIDGGKCHEIRKVSFEEAGKAPFLIIASYERWKQVIHKVLDPVKGMMQGKLKLKGHLPTIVRFVKASQELVNCATQVDTRFLDE
ncbi:MAG: hypothetical protein GXP49_17465 [Deltaproteobacteria bacterium]|nr:hypothetical protein [Deltaproteobacteria bacterium]